MHVRPKTGVVREIPAVVIRIVVKNDWIVIPIPVTDVHVIDGCHAEVKPTESETIARAACQSIDMPTADGAGKVSVFPSTVDMEPSVSAPSLVSNPSSVRVDVWRVRMSLAVTEIGPRDGARRANRRGATCWRRMRGLRAATFLSMLRKRAGDNR